VGVNRIVLSATFIVSAVLLTGCDPALLLGPLAVSKENGALQVAVCQDITVTAVYAEERSLLGQWTSFWDGHGEVHLKTGDIISSASLESDLASSTVIKDPSWFPARGLAFILTADPDGPGPTIAAAFDGGLAQIEEGSWTQTDGSVTIDPCP
jgi:hypothetical protein